MKTAAAGTPSVTACGRDSSLSEGAEALRRGERTDCHGLRPRNDRYESDSSGTSRTPSPTNTCGGDKVRGGWFGHRI